MVAVFVRLVKCRYAWERHVLQEEVGCQALTSNVVSCISACELVAQACNSQAGENMEVRESNVVQTPSAKSQKLITNYKNKCKN